MSNVLRIGVIDSGYSPEQAPHVCASRAFHLVDSQLQEGPSSFDCLQHGTAIIDSFAQHAGAAELCVAQVFSQRFSTSALQIAAAIYWLIEQDVALINLSLGVRQDREVLRLACEAAAKAGIILCAASPARGEKVYPASYPDVFRITGDARCEPGQWSWLNNAQADFGASVRSNNPRVIGSSVASAILSGLVADYWVGNPLATRHDLLRYLTGEATFHGPERRIVADVGSHLT